MHSLGENGKRKFYFSSSVWRLMAKIVNTTLKASAKIWSFEAETKAISPRPTP